MQSVWSYRLLYVGLCFVMILGSLFPFELFSGSFPAPNLLLAVTFAWLLRRPDYVPLWLIAAVFLFADFLLMKPLGLETLMAVGVTEVLRRQVQQRDTLTVPVELLQVSLWIWITLGATRLVLIVLGTPVPPLSSELLYILSTMSCYPIILLITQYLFGVRRLQGGESDSLGSRV